jgi:holo-[acyl-carrier protein] synthase
MQAAEGPGARNGQSVPDNAAALPRVQLGTYIVAVQRLAALLADQPALSRRVFTARELSYCEGRRRTGEHLAVRFAAKEAVLKALGAGLGARMRWTDVEVVNGLSGRPEVRLHGQAAVAARRRRMHQIDVSLSHTAGLAIACAAVVCRGEDAPAAADPAERVTAGDPAERVTAERAAAKRAAAERDREDRR